jgi:hypothetical protein
MDDHRCYLQRDLARGRAGAWRFNRRESQIDNHLYTVLDSAVRTNYGERDRLGALMRVRFGRLRIVPIRP